MLNGEPLPLHDLLGVSRLQAATPAVATWSYRPESCLVAFRAPNQALGIQVFGAQELGTELMKGLHTSLLMQLNMQRSFPRITAQKTTV